MDFVVCGNSGLLFECACASVRWMFRYMYD